MTVSYIMNTIDRFDITPKVTADNRNTAGHPIRQYIVTDNGSKDMRIKRWAAGFAHKFIDNAENVGNAQALNNAMKVATGDIIVIAGNDIKLQNKWLSEAIKLIQENPKVGLIGFNWRGNASKTKEKHGNLNEQVGNVFGTWVMSRKVYDKVGPFNEFSKYGLWDSAYNHRCEKAGFINGYIHGIDSEHIGNDVGESSEYRKMKDREMAKAKKAYSEFMGTKPKKRRKRTTKK
jgi:GT2 family glycosyltransferase